MRLDPHYPDIVLHFLAQANFNLGKYEIAAPRRAGSYGLSFSKLIRTSR